MSVFQRKIEEAKEFIASLIAPPANPHVKFDGDDCSVVLLHLIKETGGGKIPFPVLHIDTSLHFPEVYKFMDAMQRSWDFALIRERNDDALNAIDVANPRDKCCNELKAVPQARAAAKYNVSHLMLGECAATGKDSAAGRTEQADGYMRCYPLLFFTADDIRNYINEYGLPRCPLYDRGYERIECYPCAGPVRKTPGISKDTVELERRLKALGYL